MMARAHEVAQQVAARLAAEGLPSPGADARLLVAHALGIDLTGMLFAGAPSPAQEVALEQLVRRRAAGEPIQHLTGEAHFRYETLRVGPGVFIPRPETEMLVDLALEALAPRPVDQRRVVELCAGSGAISLSLVRELGGVEAHAVELSDDAWPFLQHNLAGTGVATVHGDMATAFGDLAGRVDLVVANPPYIPERFRAELPGDVLHDPDLALFSGADGLDAMRVVAARAHLLLRPGGWVMAEHDETHAPEVVALFVEAGFDDVTDHADLSGRPRHVVARRPDGDNMAGLGA